MSQYDVYAIGNALVDVEYSIEPEELTRLGIDKGVMTLVEADQQSEMMAALAAREVNRSAGGSAANTVIAVSQFGGRGFYSCRIGDDDLGRIYAEDLAANGVTSNAAQHRESGDTGRCLVFVTPDADRTMQTYLGVTGALGVDAVAADALTASRWFYFEGYLATSPSAREAVARAREIAREAGVPTAISLSDPNIVQHFGGELREMIGTGVDFVFANEDEVMGLTGADDLDTALAELGQITREFAVTRGAEGALIHNGHGVIEVPAHKVTPLDTVGAGDMFAGAFLHARSQGHDHASAGHFANAAAARLITEYGPRFKPDVAHEVLAAFQRQHG